MQSFIKRQLTIGQSKPTNKAKLCLMIDIRLVFIRRRLPYFRVSKAELIMTQRKKRYGSDFYDRKPNTSMALGATEKIDRMRFPLFLPERQRKGWKRKTEDTIFKRTKSVERVGNYAEKELMMVLKVALVKRRVEVRTTSARNICTKESQLMKLEIIIIFQNLTNQSQQYSIQFC